MRKAISHAVPLMTGLLVLAVAVGCLAQAPAHSEESFVLIAGGCFEMGSSMLELPRDADESQHEVCVEDFGLMSAEVSVAQFSRFIDDSAYETDAERGGANRRGCWTRLSGNPSEWGFDPSANWRSPLPPALAKPGEPVSCVSWNDAQAYVEWFNDRQPEDKPRVRLPTESEWEFAARGGSPAPYSWGLTPENSCSHANLADKSHGAANNIGCDDGYASVAPTATFSANAFGLYDMTGNVWEWTCSVYDAEYTGAEKQCAASNAGGNRSSRGGSYDDDAKGGRIANRSSIPPNIAISLQGFRLARHGKTDAL